MGAWLPALLFERQMNVANNRIYPDVDNRSKRAILNENEEQRRATVQILVDLFCENPHHWRFKDMTEAELADLRRERLRRIEGGK
jgi:hypothetical protein